MYICCNTSTEVVKKVDLIYTILNFIVLFSRLIKAEEHPRQSGNKQECCMLDMKLGNLWL